MSSDQEISDVLDSYFSNYEKLNFAVCEGMWDFDHPKISLKPTEMGTPITTAAEIREYFQLNNLIDLELWRPTSIRIIDFVRDDVVFVLADMICRFTIKDGTVQRAKFATGELPWVPGHQVRWTGISSFVLHKKKGDWKLIHYEDSTKWNLHNVE